MAATLVTWLATGFGLGWIGPAPGTLGALIGVPIAYWLTRYPAVWQAVAVACLIAVAIPLSAAASAMLGGGDSSAIVADEFLAFPLACIALPRSGRVIWIGAAFALYRLFDIAKVWPISAVEWIGGGFGITLDDVLAALLARSSLQLALIILRRLGGSPLGHR